MGTAVLPPVVLAGALLELPPAPGRTEDVFEREPGGRLLARRAAVRTRLFLDLRAEGRHGAYAAVSVEASRAGMLFRILDRDFAPEGEAALLHPYLARVRFHFGGGLLLHLPDCRRTVAAVVTNVAPYRRAGDDAAFIACRFLAELSGERCRALGIAWGEDR